VLCAPAPGNEAQHVERQFPCVVRELEQCPVTTCGVVDAGAAGYRELLKRWRRGQELGSDVAAGQPYHVGAVG
jgi:hypothetical protein